MEPFHMGDSRETRWIPHFVNAPACLAGNDSMWIMTGLIKTLEKLSIVTISDGDS